MMFIAEKMAVVQERINKACVRAGRNPGEITLMGVTKFLPLEKAEEAYRAGMTCFGESRVKEGAEKFEFFKERQSVQLHLIGSLQRNKAKTAALFFDFIESIDRLEIIAELAKHLQQRQKPLGVFLELHTGEETKSGFTDLDSLYRAAEAVMRHEMKPCGLMTIAPYTDDEELIRKSFRQLVKARGELQKRFPAKENWSCLSMGMSNDFEIAIEEGANLLRIGSLIFKE